MFIETDRGRIDFSFNESVGDWASIFELPLWSTFRSTSSQRDSNASKVLLVLKYATEEEDLEYSWEHLHCYVNCLRWFLQNEREIQESALSTISTLINELNQQYRAWDNEWLANDLNNALHQMIDLYSVNFYPESKDDLPYFGLEFVCNWDSHGCGMMFHGTHVVMVGQGEIADAFAFDFEKHGAYVEF